MERSRLHVARYADLATSRALKSRLILSGPHLTLGYQPREQQQAPNLEKISEIIRSAPETTGKTMHIPIDTPSIVVLGQKSNNVSLALPLTPSDELQGEIHYYADGLSFDANDFPHVTLASGVLIEDIEPAKDYLSKRLSHISSIALRAVSLRIHVV